MISIEWYHLITPLAVGLAIGLILCGTGHV